MDHLKLLRLAFGVIPSLQFCCRSHIFVRCSDRICLGKEKLYQLLEIKCLRAIFCDAFAVACIFILCTSLFYDLWQPVFSCLQKAKSTALKFRTPLCCVFLPSDTNAPPSTSLAFEAQGHFDAIAAAFGEASWHHTDKFQDACPSNNCCHRCHILSYNHMCMYRSMIFDHPHMCHHLLCPWASMFGLFKAGAWSTVSTWQPAWVKTKAAPWKCDCAVGQCRNYCRAWT